AIAKPSMRRARAGTRRGYKISRLIRIGRRAVRDADRRVLIPVADLKSGGAPHPADIADKRFTYARSHLRSRTPVLFYRCRSIAMLLLFQMEFGGLIDVAGADRPPLSVVGGQEATAAPSTQCRRELPAEVDRIGNAGVHAQSARRGQLMHGVAGQKNP